MCLDARFFTRSHGFPFPLRSQAYAEDGTDGAEEKQKERLLQGAGGRQERN